MVAGLPVWCAGLGALDRPRGAVGVPVTHHLTQGSHDHDTKSREEIAVRILQVKHVRPVAGRPS